MPTLLVLKYAGPLLIVLFVAFLATALGSLVNSERWSTLMMQGYLPVALACTVGWLAAMGKIRSWPLIVFFVLGITALGMMNISGEALFTSGTFDNFALIVPVFFGFLTVYLLGRWSPVQTLVGISSAMNEVKGIAQQIKQGIAAVAADAPNLIEQGKAAAANLVRSQSLPISSGQTGKEDIVPFYSMTM